MRCNCEGLCVLCFRFSNFDVEPNFDYVYVYDGVGDDKMLLGAITGEYGHQASVRLDAFESDKGQLTVGACPVAHDCSTMFASRSMTFRDSTKFGYVRARNIHPHDLASYNGG